MQAHGGCPAGVNMDVIVKALDAFKKIFGLILKSHHASKTIYWKGNPKLKKNREFEGISCNNYGTIMCVCVCLHTKLI